ncbi:histidine kinase [Lysobacter korlensis]|uniref:histidine kinase n=1 Tax=Lysobacter korlensis TaxID=553636 RepID=A0ABV6S0Q4_9GAMM
MESTRGWSAAVAAVCTVLLAIALLSGRGAERTLGAATAVVLFGVAWVIFGRRGWSSRSAARTFVVGTIVLAGVATSFIPTMAIIQTIGFPLVWVLAASVKSALVANVAFALSVGVGFLVSNGTSPGSLTEAGLTVAVSLGFSLAMGLWISRIATLSEERLALVEQLTAAQQQLDALGREAGAVAERERLARELHDTIAQDLTALVMLSQRARRELTPGTDAARAETLRLLEDTARSTLAETRALVAVHAKVELPEGGILSALGRLAENFGRESGVDAALEVEGTLPRLPRDAEVVLLRCAQEGLANVRKHAGASRVRLRIWAEAHEVRLQVRDDGRGFDPARASGGFGLSGMRDRLALAQGTLAVDSSDAGTTLTVILPIGVRA